jgi:hypothetical protein
MGVGTRILQLFPELASGGCGVALVVHRRRSHFLGRHRVSHLGHVLMLITAGQAQLKKPN